VTAPALAVLSLPNSQILTRGAKAKLEEVPLLFKPDTVLKWHRDLVRRKWIPFKKRRPVGH